MSLWVEISWKAWGQVNRQRLEETMYLPCHSCYIYCETWRDKEVGFFLKLSYGGKGKSHKQEEEFLWDAMKKLPKEFTTELLYLKLPTISSSCGVRRYMHYIRFLLTKIS